MNPEALGMQPAWIFATVLIILGMGVLWLVAVAARWIWQIGEKHHEEDER